MFGKYNMFGTKNTLFSIILLMAVCLPAAAQQPATVEVTQRLSEAEQLKVKELYFAALREKSAGRLMEAVELLNKIVTLDPQNDAALYELARIHFSGKDLGKAAAFARQAANVNPDNEWYWVVLADVYKQIEDFDALVPVMGELIRLKPDHQEYYYDRAYALFLDKKYEEALETYRRIELQFGSNDNILIARQQVYLAQKQPKKALEELLQRQKDRPDDRRNYLLLADLHMKLGKPKEALEVLDGAQKKFKSDPYISLSRADVYRAMNKESAVVDELQDALKNDQLDVDAKIKILRTYFSRRTGKHTSEALNELCVLLTRLYPDEAKVFALYGDVLARQERFKEARTFYQKAVKLDPQKDKVWEQLLTTTISAEMFNEAREIGQEALALFPEHPVISFFAGQISLMKGDHAGARKLLETALNNIPEGGDTVMLIRIYAVLGDVYNALKMFGESDVAYRESLALDSNNAYVLNNFAYYLALLKDKLDDAERMALKANELEPNNASYEDTYAWVLFNRGRFEDARTWIEKAIEHATEPSEVLLEHYGDILYHLGERERALETWKEAMKVAKAADKPIDNLSKKIEEKRYVE